MDIKYTSDSNGGEYSASYHITNDFEEDIGTVEGFLSQYGELVTVVKVYNRKYQKQGIGFRAFKKVHDELNILSESTALKNYIFKEKSPI